MARVLINLFNKYLLSAFYILDPVLGADEQNIESWAHGVYILAEDRQKKGDKAVKAIQEWSGEKQGTALVSAVREDISEEWVTFKLRLE